MARRCCGCSVRCCCCLLVLTLLALAVTAAVVFARYKDGGNIFPIPGLPDPKYAEALAVALRFFQVQKCTSHLNGAMPIHAILPRSTSPNNLPPIV
jgi:hypothetical protein